MCVKLKGFLASGIIFLGALALVLVSFAGDDRVLAEGPSAGSFAIGEVYGATGRHVEVAITYEDVVNFSGVAIELTYNTDILDAVDVIKDPSIPVHVDGDDTTFNFNLDEPGKVIITWGYQGYDGLGWLVPESGTFCRVRFFMLAEGTSDLEFTVLDVTYVTGGGGEGEDTISVAVADPADGKVDVYDVTYGDVNEDSSINFMDSLLILRYRAGDPEVSLSDRQKLAADVNLDENINFVDALLILRFRANDPEVPSLPVE